MESSAHSSDTASAQRSAALTVYRPLVEKVLAALGALVVHHFAYLFSGLIGGGGTATDHGHLSLQWAIVSPLVVLAVSGFAVRQFRELGFRLSLSLRALSGFIIGFFLLQELVEGLIDGRSPLTVVAHPAIAIGVVLAPLVAWLLTKLMAGVTELAARLLSEPPFGGPPDRPILIPLPVRVSSTNSRSPSRPRAPPSRLRH